VTLKEIVCEDVDWINLALDKYCEGIKHFSFHEGVEFLSYHCQFLKLKCLPYSADEGVGKAYTNHRGPAVQKGARSPIMLQMFLCFSVVFLFAVCTN